MIVCVDGARSLNEVAPIPTILRVLEGERLTRPGRRGWGPEKTFLVEWAIGRVTLPRMTRPLARELIF